LWSTKDERGRAGETWGEFRSRNADLFDDCPGMEAAQAAALE
jgi:hypothetical protein